LRRKYGQALLDRRRALDKAGVLSRNQIMYDHLRRLSASALIALAVICIISSAAQFNGTTYHLGQKEATVVVPVNSSKINLTLFEKTANITLLDENGKNIALNTSYQFWRGDHIYSLTFIEHVKGELIYTLPLQGQQFILPLKDDGQVRIILPKGYTTGERSLGIARPSPDEFMTNDTGNILTWYNTSGISYIEVNYYRNNAPSALMMIFVILAAAGIVLLVRYYISNKRLKEMKIEDK
jgi:hypothetical protein